MLCRGEPGVFTLNGGGARLGEIGDICIVMTFEMLEQYRPARVVHCDEKNCIAKSFHYSSAQENREVSLIPGAMIRS
jgi:aspartate 1-decarboxylase